MQPQRRKQKSEQLAKLLGIAVPQVAAVGQSQAIGQWVPRGREKGAQRLYRTQAGGKMSQGAMCLQSQSDRVPPPSLGDESQGSLVLCRVRSTELSETCFPPYLSFPAQEEG